MKDSEATTQEFKAERVCAECGHNNFDSFECMQASTMPDGDVVRCGHRCVFPERVERHAYLEGTACGGRLTCVYRYPNGALCHESQDNAVHALAEPPQESVAELLRRAFMTCVSDGTGAGRIEIRFGSLETAQAVHSLLVAQRDTLGSPGDPKTHASESISALQAET